LLRETLASVAAQSFTDYEIIVVDDGDSAQSAEAVCAEFPQCHYICQQERGRSNARNRGIAEADGELVAFVDDDDLWKAHKLERQVAFLEEHPEVGVVHGPAEIIGTDNTPTGQLTGDDKLYMREGAVFAYAARVSIVKSPTPLVRKAVFSRCGLFDPHLHAGEDWEFWARVAYHYQFGYIPEPLAYYRLHAGTTTVSDKYLPACLHIAQKLSAFVEPQDRHIVRREVCYAYLGGIRLQTPKFSPARYHHLRQAFGLWPRCAGWKIFWSLLIGR
jgi:glycosyltransferase involved in cell wall biosynthesis